MDTDMNGSSVAGGPSMMNLSDFRHHTLRFRYPAFELLPAGKQPFLETPRGLPDREEPETTPMGLSADDLEFLVRFPAEHGVPAKGTPGKRENAVLKLPLALDLAAAIASLSSFAGISELSFASYVDDWDVITRFQLKSTLYNDFGKLDDQPQGFELGSADIAKMIRTMSDKEEWVRLLDDLIHAKSDRAYLYRNTVLAEWDPDWLNDDEEKWNTWWDVNPLDSAKQLFANRLVSVYRQPHGTIVREKLGDLDDFRDEALYVELPCGHRSFISENWIHDMNPHDALNAVCDDCDQRILSKKDLRKLHYYYDRARRYEWEDQLADWIPKCRKVRNESTLVEISSGTLNDSLLNALNTFELPESINPRALCPTTYPESRALLNKLIDTLKQHNSLPAMTPKALFTNLEKLAWQLVQDMVGDATIMAVVLPPGFDDFVSRWMTRAVNDAVGTQADDGQDDDMMDVVTQMKRSKIDPKAAAVEDDFDSILRQIGKTSLRASADHVHEGEAEKKEQDGEEEL